MSVIFDRRLEPRMQSENAVIKFCGTVASIKEHCEHMRDFNREMYQLHGVAIPFEDYQDIVGIIWVLYLNENPDLSKALMSCDFVKSTLEEPEFGVYVDLLLTEYIKSGPDKFIADRSGALSLVKKINQNRNKSIKEIVYDKLCEALPEQDDKFNYLVTGYNAARYLSVERYIADILRTELPDEADYLCWVLFGAYNTLAVKEFTTEPDYFPVSEEDLPFHSFLRVGMMTPYGKIYKIMDTEWCEYWFYATVGEGLPNIEVTFHIS